MRWNGWPKKITEFSVSEMSSTCVFVVLIDFLAVELRPLLHVDWLIEIASCTG
jgi:hypothetical protein